VIPVVCVAAGVTVSFATIAVDRATGFDLVPSSLTGGPQAAVAILSTIATAEVTLCALVLTVTMVVVQLAMGQFSPRIVASFLRDKPSQIAIGLFVATFAHAILAMREVGDGRVPGLAVLVAFVLVVLSIGALVVYVDHIGKSLRVSSLIELVGDATRGTLDERYPDRIDGRSAPAREGEVRASHSGVLSHVDERALVAADTVLEVQVALGAFVPAGSVVAVSVDRRAVDAARVRDALVLGLDRSLDQDVAYGVRMLVDIAERSLAESPFLDPTTAVQSLDRLHDCMRQLVGRRFPDGRLCDEQGRTRVLLPVMRWADYVTLAFDEIRLAGAGSPQVSRRLVEVLDDLLAIAPEERRPPLERQRRLLDATVRERYEHPSDVETALTPDREGIGAALRDGRSVPSS
jgi:uncharacterized membrane protein